MTNTHIDKEARRAIRMLCAILQANKFIGTIDDYNICLAIPALTPLPADVESSPKPEGLKWGCRWNQTRKGWPSDFRGYLMESPTGAYWLSVSDVEAVWFHKDAPGSGNSDVYLDGDRERCFAALNACTQPPPDWEDLAEIQYNKPHSSVTPPSTSQDNAKKVGDDKPAQPKVMPWPEDLTTLIGKRITTKHRFVHKTLTEALVIRVSEWKPWIIVQVGSERYEWCTAVRDLLSVEEVHPQPAADKGAENRDNNHFNSGVHIEAQRIEMDRLVASGMFTPSPKPKPEGAWFPEGMLPVDLHYRLLMQQNIVGCDDGMKLRDTQWRSFIESERAQHKAEMEAVKKELQSQDETASWVAAVLAELDRGGGLGMCTHKKLKECVDLLRKREKELESAKGASR